ncbi:hypothetical protein ACFLYC_03190, partial [Chloroflexota bacterium]
MEFGECSTIPAMGLDLTAELRGVSRFRKTTTLTIGSLCAVIVGASASEIPIEVRMNPTSNIKSYGFTL